MKGATLLDTLYSLGITPSRSRPRVSNDNPYAESIFRTCKYRPEYPTKGFESRDAAREWVLQFVRWYNLEHRHSGLNFLTPNQRHQGLSEQIFDNRRQVYEAAKAQHPLRWTGNTRNWSLDNEVWLNPEKVGVLLNYILCFGRIATTILTNTAGKRLNDAIKQSILVNK